jgi:hypothetical protein
VLVLLPKIVVSTRQKSSENYCSKISTGDLGVTKKGDGDADRVAALRCMLCSLGD